MRHNVSVFFNPYKASVCDIWNRLGNVLLIGEGNLSFARALLAIPQSGISCMTATTLEREGELSEDASRNASFLQREGVRVLHEVDISHLNKMQKITQYARSFNNIVFQFPNTGSRESKYGNSSNHMLIRRFLRNTASLLKNDGKVIITTVDSSYYNGLFQFERAAEREGYALRKGYPFDPKKFPGYIHTNTNDEESALSRYHLFVSRRFQKI